MSAPTDNKAAQLASLIAASQTSMASSKYQLIVFSVLVLGVIVGGFFVYKKLTETPAEKDDANAATGPSGGGSNSGLSRLCKPDEQVITCKGRSICAPICKAPQVLQCSGATGAEYATCVCPVGSTPHAKCGCVATSCPAGQGVCPDQGVCQCTGPAACAATVDPYFGTVGGKFRSVDCPQTCLSLYSCLNTNDGSISQAQKDACRNSMDATCKASTCLFDVNNDPFKSFPECSVAGSKFSRYDADAQRCIKDVDCSMRVDPLNAVYGPGTKSNLATIYQRFNDTGGCTPNTLTDIANLCNFDPKGCPVGFAYDDAIKMCVNKADGTSVAPKTAGSRPLDSQRYWDTSLCVDGSPSYRIKSTVTTASSLWQSSTRNNVTQYFGNTVLSGYLAVPSDLLTTVYRVEVDCRECDDDGFVRDVGIRRTALLTCRLVQPNEQLSFPQFPDSDYRSAFTVKPSEMSSYTFLYFDVVLSGLASSTSSFLTATDTAKYVNSPFNVTYRLSFGLQTTTPSGRFTLTSVSVESNPQLEINGQPSPCKSNVKLCGQPVSVNVSRSGIQTFIPAPALDKTFALEKLNANGLAVINTNTATAATVVDRGSQLVPYVVAACTPETCNLQNAIQITQQVLVMGITCSEPIPAGYTGAVFMRRLDISSTSPTVSWTNFVDSVSRTAGFVITPSTVQKPNADGSVTYLLSDIIDSKPVNRAYPSSAYLYQIGVFWYPDTDPAPGGVDLANSYQSRYQDAIRQGRATLLLQQNVVAPSYTKDTCWSIPYTAPAPTDGSAPVPVVPRYVYDASTNSCVGSNKFTVSASSTNPYPSSTNAASDFLNIFSAAGPNGTYSFANADFGNLQILEGNKLQTLQSVPKMLPEFKGPSGGAYVLADSDNWSQKGYTGWFSGASGTVEVGCPRYGTLGTSKILLSPQWKHSGETPSRTVQSILDDMEKFGQNFVPNYQGVPSSTNILSYVYKDANNQTRPFECPIYDMATQGSDPNRWLNQGRNIAMAGYTSSNPTNMETNKYIVDRLKASNNVNSGFAYGTATTDKVNPQQYPGWVDQLSYSPSIRQGDDYVRFSADYKILDPSRDAAKNAKWDPATKTLKVEKAFTCSNAGVYSVSNPGTKDLSANCGCNAVL